MMTKEDLDEIRARVQGRYDSPEALAAFERFAPGDVGSLLAEVDRLRRVAGAALDGRTWDESPQSSTVSE